MSVVISNGATTISTANGFYRCEAYNMNFIGGVGNVTTPSTPCHRTTTFANAGNLKGIGLGVGSVSPNQNRSIRICLAQNNGTFTVTVASPAVFTQASHGLNDLDEVFLVTTGALPTGLTNKTVKYYVRNATTSTFNLSATPTGSLINTSGTQSGTHTLWVIRMQELFTVDKIMPANVHVNDSYFAYMIVPFEFTTPYAVDTTADKWRFIFWQEGGTAGTYYFCVSDATAANENFTYFAWCDNQVSFTNDDVLICKDRVTVDASFSVKGILGTGNTVYSDACLICRGLNKGVNDIANLVWENAPASSYTMTVNGAIVLGSFSGIQIGSEASPIPASEKAIIEFVPASVGTDISCIRATTYSTTSRPCGKNSFVLYGEVPTNRYGVLASNANTGQNKITLTEDLSAIWQVGDEIAIGKQNTKSANGSITTYTISSFNGAEITLNTNIASYSRIAGATVINKSRGYGIEIRSNADTRYHRIESVIPLHARFSGIKFINTYVVSTLYATTQYYEDISGTKPYYCDNLSWMTQTTAVYLFSIAVISRLGVDIKRNLCWRSNLLSNIGALYATALKSGVLTVEDNRIISSYSANLGTASTSNYKIEIKNNIWENPYYAPIVLYGRNPIVSGNTFWGASTSYPALYLSTLCLNPVMSNNSFDNCNWCYGFIANAIAINGISRDDRFGQEVANTYEVLIGTSALGDFTITDPVGAVKVDATLLPDTVNGFKLRIQNDNSVANVDKMYLTEGYYVRCGDGLADTTVHTSGSGKFSLRMEPLLEALKFEQYIPTGNIQNMTMSVGVWVKINSASYWAGTNVLPKLIIDYDDGTIAYATAAQSTDWQFLIVPFMPLTTAGRIKVTVQAETDATGSNAYVYWDDFAILYPAGVQLNLGGLDLWSGAEPINPTLATNVSAADVWAYPTSGLTAAGTTGKKLVDDLTTGNFIGLNLALK